MCVMKIDNYFIIKWIIDNYLIDKCASLRFYLNESKSYFSSCKNKNLQIRIILTWQFHT